MESKAISAQLRMLEKNRIVIKKPTSTKNHFYQISERFFNIWFLMRNGRKKEKNQVLWLTRFLEVWCDREELVERAKRHQKAVQGGVVCEPEAFYMTEALARTGLSSEMQDSLIKETILLLQKKGNPLSEQLSESDKELFEKAENYYKKKEYDLALKTYNTIYSKNGVVLNSIGVCYFELFDIFQAEKYFKMACDKGNNAAQINIAAIYFLQGKNKSLAFKFATKAYKPDSSLIVKLYYILIALWNDDFEKSSSIALPLFQDPAILDHEYPIQQYLLLLIAKHQYNLALRLFRESPLSLRERYRPIYYALMYFMRDTIPDEFKKMGSELEQTVMEIVEEIKKMGETM